MKKNRTAESIEYKFINPYTKEEEEYEYYLDIDDVIEAIKLYASFYGVNLDGTDGHILELFSSLDSGNYEYINEIYEKVCESEYIRDDLKAKLEEKAKEEFEEYAEENLEPEE